MKVYTWFFLFIIFASTYSAEVKNTPTENKRSVNLALETVLEFNNKDNSADIRFLDDLQKFIAKVKGVIGKTQNPRRSFGTPKAKIETFTDFLQEVLNIVSSYEDPDFQDFFQILDEEIRKYHYRGCKFYELTENYEIRKFLTGKINLINGKDVLILKAYINVLADILKDEKYDDHVKELVDYINSLYREDARPKFQRVLTDLENYVKTKSKRTNSNLVKIVKDGIRSILFNYYTDLNPNARRELRSKIEIFWKQDKGNQPPGSETVNKDDSKKENDIKFSKNVPDVKNPEPIKSEESLEFYKKEETKTEDSKENENVKSNRIEIKKSDYKNTVNMMRSGKKKGKRKKVSVKHTKKYTSNEETGETEITSQTSEEDVHTHKKMTKTHHDQQSGQSSSDEVNTKESFESNSIEVYQEKQKQKNTQRYMTLYPEKIAYRSETTTPTIDTRKIVHRSGKSRISKYNPSFQTLWIEESTGRLPKIITESTPKHKHKKHSKHRSSSDEKHKSSFEKSESSNEKPSYEKHKPKHVNKYGSKHGSTHGTKHSSKHKSKHHHKKDFKRKQRQKERKIESTYDSKYVSNHDRNKETERQVARSILRHRKEETYKKEHDVSEITRKEFYENKKKAMEPDRIELRLENGTMKQSTPTIPIPMESTLPRILNPATRPTITSRSQVPSSPALPPRKGKQRLTNHVASIMIPSMPTLRSNRNTSSTKKYMVSPVLEHYVKRYEMFAGKQNRQFRKSGPPPKKFYEGLSIEQFTTSEKKRRESFRRNSKNNTERRVQIVELSVIKKLKDLEIELNEVKDKISNVNINLLKERKSSNMPKVYIEKGKKIDNMRKNIHADSIRKDKFKVKGTAEKEPEYVTELKDTKDNKFEETKVFKPVEAKFNNNYTKNMKVTEEPVIKYDEKEIENNNNIDDINKKEKAKEKGGDNEVTLGLEEGKQENGRDVDKNLGIGFEYDSADVWEGSLKSVKKTNTKRSSWKTTESTTVNTTTSSKTTNTNGKMNEIVTETTTIVSIPVSVPAVAPTTMLPQIITQTTDVKAKDDLVQKNKTPENALMLVSRFAAPINKSNTYTKQDTTKMEISNDNNVTTPIANVKVVNETKYSTPQLSRHINFNNNLRVQNDLAAPPNYPQDIYSSVPPTNLFTDALNGIDDGIADLML